MNELKVRKVHLKNKDIKEIYFSCFNKDSRLPFPFMIFLSKLFFTKFYGFYVDNKAIGFIYYNVSISSVFIMFLGISSNYQNQGYGSKIIDYLKARYPKKCIITSYTLTKKDNDKRRRFYFKNVFIKDKYNMIFLFKKHEVLTMNKKLHHFRFFIFMVLYSFFVIWIIFYKPRNNK